MKLSHLFTDIIFDYNHNKIDIITAINKCATIAEDFSIGFTEWCSNYTCKNRNINNEILHSKSKYDDFYTTKELLEIYKKHLSQ